MVKAAQYQSLSCLVSTQFSSVLEDKSEAGSVSFDRLMTYDPAIESYRPWQGREDTRGIVRAVPDQQRPDLCSVWPRLDP